MKENTSVVVHLSELENVVKQMRDSQMKYVLLEIDNDVSIGKCLFIRAVKTEDSETDMDFGHIKSIERLNH